MVLLYGNGKHINELRYKMKITNFRMFQAELQIPLSGGKGFDVDRQRFYYRFYEVGTSNQSNGTQVSRSFALKYNRSGWAKVLLRSTILVAFATIE